MMACFHRGLDECLCCLLHNIHHFFPCRVLARMRRVELVAEGPELSLSFDISNIHQS